MSSTNDAPGRGNINEYRATELLKLNIKPSRVTVETAAKQRPAVSATWRTFPSLRLFFARPSGRLIFPGNLIDTSEGNCRWIVMLFVSVTGCSLRFFQVPSVRVPEECYLVT